MKASAGNRGDKIRSDCYIELQLCHSGGHQINLKSKVEVLYGKSIRRLCSEILHFFQIQNCQLYVEDTGAFDWVIAARLEAAVKQLIDTDQEFLFPIDQSLIYTTEKNKPRRSRLYIPGNKPKLMLKAGIFNSDGIIFDLEDSVASNKKTESRFLIRNALRAIDLYRVERMVRINHLPEGLKDIEAIVNHPVNLILIPKCETANDVITVSNHINTLTPLKNIHLMPIIESAKGVLNAYSIASACDRVVALAIGLEDYTANLGVERTKEGTESLWARNIIVNVASALGIQAIDSVYSNIEDQEGFIQHIQNSRNFGFTGIGCIHPRQIELANKGYNPSKSQIEKAKKIINEYEREDSGVTALDGAMIDAPVVKKAYQVVENAIEHHLLTESWRNNNEN